MEKSSIENKFTIKYIECVVRSSYEFVLEFSGSGQTCRLVVCNVKNARTTKCILIFSDTELAAFSFIIAEQCSLSSPDIWKELAGVKT